MKKLQSSMDSFKVSMIGKSETSNLNGGIWIKTSGLCDCNGDGQTNNDDKDMQEVNLEAAPADVAGQG